MNRKSTLATRRSAIGKALAVLASFAVMPGMVRLGFASADKAAPAVKKSKETAEYQDQPKNDQSCGKCILYAGEGECVIVEGKVSPNGWCKYWTPTTMGRTLPENSDRG